MSAANAHFLVGVIRDALEQHATPRPERPGCSICQGALAALNQLARVRELVTESERASDEGSFEGACGAPDRGHGKSSGVAQSVEHQGTPLVDQGQGLVPGDAGSTPAAGRDNHYLGYTYNPSWRKRVRARLTVSVGGPEFRHLLRIEHELGRRQGTAAVKSAVIDVLEDPLKTYSLTDGTYKGTSPMFTETAAIKEAMNSVTH